MKEPFSIGDGLEIYNCDICHHKKVLGRMKETTEKGKKKYGKKIIFVCIDCGGGIKYY